LKKYSRLVEYLKRGAEKKLSDGVVTGTLRHRKATKKPKKKGHGVVNVAKTQR